MRSIDRVVVVLLIVAIIAISTAFAVFSFYDPIQAGVFEGAKELIGAPVQWQFNFQHPFSETERELYRFHNFLLGINVAICALVAGLVTIAVWLFRSSRHPVPGRSTHNTPLELLWTILPIVVLVVMAPGHSRCCTKSRSFRNRMSA
jgi:hypothetical protein